MKKLFLIALIAASGLIAFSQTPEQRAQRTPEMRAQQVLNGWIFEPLNLTAEQKTKTQAILVEEYKSLDAITATIPQTTGMGERQAQMAALAPKLAPVRAASEKKFLAILTAAQRKNYAESVKLRPQDRGFGENFPMPVGSMTKNPDAHDPVMVKEGDTYYVFYTNGGISGWSSFLEPHATTPSSKHKVMNSGKRCIER